MTLTVADLIGYVERDLDGDVARWLAGEDRVAVPADTRPVTPFAARLAPADAAALSGLDRRVRAGTFPQILDAYDWSYGFDFAGNEVGLADSDGTELTDDDVYAIGADGGGNYYVVLTNGQVVVWFHEEEALEADTRFDNLDVFVWSTVRFAAVRAGALSVADVEADFRALGQPGALHPELGLLARLTG